VSSELALDRLDRRRARLRVEQRDLPEDLARLEEGEDHPLAVRPRGRCLEPAAHHHEELITGIALGEEDLSAAQLTLLVICSSLSSSAGSSPSKIPDPREQLALVEDVSRGHRTQGCEA
jgi:hypothetical protein